MDKYYNILILLQDRITQAFNSTNFVPVSKLICDPYFYILSHNKNNYQNLSIDLYIKTMINLNTKSIDIKKNMFIVFGYSFYNIISHHIGHNIPDKYKNKCKTVIISGISKNIIFMIIVNNWLKKVEK